MIKRATMAIFQLPSLINSICWFQEGCSSRFQKTSGPTQSHQTSRDWWHLLCHGKNTQNFVKDKDQGILSNDRKTIIIRSCQEFLCFHFGWSAVTLESPTKPSLIFIDEQILVQHPIQNGKNTISIQTEIKGFA